MRCQGNGKALPPGVRLGDQLYTRKYMTMDYTIILPGTLLKYRLKAHMFQGHEGGNMLQLQFPWGDMLVVLFFAAHVRISWFEFIIL